MMLWLKDWQVSEMFDGTKIKPTLGPQTAECKVWAKKKKEKKKKERKKKEKRKKKKEKLHQSTFLDADLFYFPLVDVISGSLH